MAVIRSLGGDFNGFPNLFAFLAFSLIVLTSSGGNFASSSAGYNCSILSSNNWSSSEPTNISSVYSGSIVSCSSP